MIPLPRWFAHRGGGSLAPENTLGGIRLAARLGFAAVEFDVMLSGDGTPVLIHDETLERTTNGAGPVSETADAVLFALDAGQGERIPRFSEAAALCRHYGLLANVEIKPAPGHEIRTAEVVASLTAEYWRGAAVQPLISSFSLAALAVAREVVQRFVADGPTAAELQAAKAFLVNGFALRIDSNRKLLDNVANIAWNRLPLDYLNTWTRQIERVSAADVQRAMARVLQPERMVTVVVGAAP